MQWIEIKVESHPEAVDAISEMLSSLTQHGVAVQEPFALEDDGQKWTHIPNAPATVCGYLAADEHTESILRRIDEALWYLRSIAIGDIGAMQTRVIDDEDWAETWKQYFHVTRIGRKIVIKPSWREFSSDEPNLAVIELDPGMAFGTGTHPTTRMCLEAIEDNIHAGDTVIDVGCGSGILSLCAIKLGAKSALGFDISSVAVRIARENAQLNDCADAVTVKHAGIALLPDETLCLIAPELTQGEELLPESVTHEPISPANIVLANIIARVIAELAETLYAATLPGGKLITGGIIQDKENEALDALIRAGFTLEKRYADGDWLTLVCAK